MITENEKNSSRDINMVGLFVFIFFLPAGYSNTGKKPENALARIRGLLGYPNTLNDHTHENMLGIK